MVTFKVGKNGMVVVRNTLKKLLTKAKYYAVTLRAEITTYGKRLHSQENEYRVYRQRWEGSQFQPLQYVSSLKYRNRVGASARVIFDQFFSDYSIGPINACVRTHVSVLGSRPLGIDANLDMIPDPLVGTQPTPGELASARRSLSLAAEPWPLVVDLTHPWSGNYFHWFMDLLPRLRETTHAEAICGVPAVVLTHPHLSEWQKASLARVLTNRVTLQHRTKHTLFRLAAERLVLPSSPRFNGVGDGRFDAQDPTVIAWLRKMLAPRIAARTQRRRRIFVQRRYSRRCLFETSAKKALEAAAFEFIELEDLLFEEQQVLFAESDVIVAVHGAALTNLLFADNCRVVEIIPSTYGIRPDYFQIAMHSGHRYECLVVDGLQGTNDVVITSQVADAICDMAADGKDMN